MNGIPASEQVAYEALRAIVRAIDEVDTGSDAEVAEVAGSVRAIARHALEARPASAAQEPKPVPAGALWLLDPLHALAAKWDANAARNQRNGQSLVDQGDEYGSEGLAVADALGACVVDLRAVLADAPAAPESADAHREKGSPA